MGGGIHVGFDPDLLLFLASSLLLFFHRDGFMIMKVLIILKSRGGRKGLWIRRRIRGGIHFFLNINNAYQCLSIRGLFKINDPCFANLKKRIY